MSPAPEVRRRWRLWAALAAIPLLGLLVQVPQAGAGNEVHLVAAGDFGARAATDSVLTKMAQLAPDAALALGDLAYLDRTPESGWCAYVKDRVGEGFPFELIAGSADPQALTIPAQLEFVVTPAPGDPPPSGTAGRCQVAAPPGSGSLIVRCTWR